MLARLLAISVTTRNHAKHFALKVSQAPASPFVKKEIRPDVSTLAFKILRTKLPAFPPAKRPAEVRSV